MADNTPSRLANLKELISLLSLSVQVQRETSEILADYEKRIYCLEEDQRRLLATVRTQEDQIRLLNNRYSEVLYKLSDLK